jgi:hypothetical protein
MMPFEAIEVMGRERREALMSDAKNHRLSRPARTRVRRGLVSKVSSLGQSIRRPSLRARRRPVDWDLPVPAQPSAQPDGQGGQRALTIASAVTAK